MSLVRLDQFLCLSSGAIEILVDDARGAGGEIGDDEPHIGLPARMRECGDTQTAKMAADFDT